MNKRPGLSARPLFAVGAGFFLSAVAAGADRCGEMVRWLGWLTVFLVLGVLTGALWQWRFEPAAGPQNSVSWQADLPHAVITNPARVGFQDDVLTLAAGPHPWASVEWPLGEYPQATHFGVRAEAATEGLESETHQQPAKLYFYWRNPDGEHEFADDHIAFGVGGSSPWQRYERVFTLTDRMHLICLSAVNLADSGNFRLRGLEAVPLRQRPWVPWATVALCIAWGVWVAALLRRRSGWRRALPAGAVWVFGAWFFTLPGPWLMISPLGGEFRYSVTAAPLVAEEPPPTPPPTLADQTAAIDGEVEKPPPPAAITPPMPLDAPPMASVEPEPEPEAEPPAVGRPSGRFIERVRKINRTFHIAHLGGMAVLSVAMFGFSRTHAAWIPLMALSFLSEGVQVLLGYSFGLDDARDLVMNTLGIAAGYAAWRYGERRWRGRKA